MSYATVPRTWSSANNGETPREHRVDDGVHLDVAPREALWYRRQPHVEERREVRPQATLDVRLGSLTMNKTQVGKHRHGRGRKSGVRSDNRPRSMCA